MDYNRGRRQAKRAAHVFKVVAVTAIGINPGIFATTPALNVTVWGVQAAGCVRTAGEPRKIGHYRVVNSYNFPHCCSVFGSIRTHMTR